MNERVHRQIEKEKMRSADDPNRLHYHLMPPAGLLNDPNGFVFYKGKYHIFYQWNPFETDHGSKYWGHFISEDLVHWEEAPIALAPCDWFDKNGCYSGSAIVHEDRLYLFYTGNVKDEQGRRESYQCLAYSDDGIHFTKKGPVIHVPEGYTAHFRDPKVFKRGKFWYMAIGAQTVEEKGEAVLYHSDDLAHWEFAGPIAGSGMNGLGDFGYMWECPDLFSLDGEDILLVCPQGLEPEGIKYNNIFQSGYFSGRMDYEKNSFHHGDFHELDRGFDFYAPQTTVDSKGRTLLFGWMGNAEGKEVSQPTEKYGWIHALTLPRVLEWNGGRLLQHPVPELDRLRMDEVSYPELELADGTHAFPDMVGKAFEWEMKVKDWDAEQLIIRLSQSARIIFRQDTGMLTFERKAPSDQMRTEARHCIIGELTELRLFRDTSSIELFVNGGEEVFSSRVFDQHVTGPLELEVSGNIITDIRKWNLKKVTS